MWVASEIEFHGFLRIPSRAVSWSRTIPNLVPYMHVSLRPLFCSWIVHSILAQNSLFGTAFAVVFVFQYCCTALVNKSNTKSLTCAFWVYTAMQVSCFIDTEFYRNAEWHDSQIDSVAETGKGSVVLKYSCRMQWKKHGVDEEVSVWKIKWHFNARRPICTIHTIHYTMWSRFQNLYN